LTGAFTPSISAGSKTKRFTAAIAAASNAGPPDSVTATSSTAPAAEMATWRTTVTVLPAARSASGYVASTKVTSFGGLIARGAAWGGGGWAAAGLAEAAAIASARAKHAARFIA
jgi:hypothetical protein